MGGRVRTLFLGWLAVKALWNFGTPGCWVASFLMASLIQWVATKRMLYFPDQSANWLKVSAKTRFKGSASSIAAMTVLLMPFLIGGFASLWERMDFASINSRFNLSEARFEQQYAGKEYRLLQRIPAFSKEMPTVELVNGGGGWSGGWLPGWQACPPGEHWNNLESNLGLGLISLFVFTYSIVGGYQQSSGTRRWLVLSSHIKATVGICFSLLLSAFIIYVAAIFFGLLAAQLWPIP